jgi:hypothetical protein
MNTIAKIWTAIKNATAAVYKALIGDAVEAAKGLIAGKSAFEIPLTGFFQAASAAGVVIGTVISMVAIAILFPLTIWAAVFTASGIWIALGKIFIMGHLAAAGMAMLFEHMFSPANDIPAFAAA